MALSEHHVTGDLDRFVEHLDDYIISTSATARLEARSERRIGDARMVVQVYERYSATGGNRLSLTVSAMAFGEDIVVSAIASGGSTGMFFKVNVFGEEAFLAKADDAVASFRGF